MDNDEKLKKYQKKKVLNVVILLLSLITIVLEILALFKVINMIWGIIIFIIIYLLKKNVPK